MTHISVLDRQANRLRPLSTLLLFVFLLLAGCDSGGSEPEDDGPYPALRREAPFPVGVAIATHHLNNRPHTATAGRVFDSITAEYEMKGQTMWTAFDVYNFAPSDRLVRFAEDNDMRVHGHALVWHSSVPNFLQQYPTTDEQFESAMRDYIHAVLSRYSGRVASWDVVNEAFDDGTGLLRNSIFRQKMGPDFVAKCFQFAREADPDVLLFYNDYGTIWNRRKADAMFAMIDDFQQRGIPIDGVGLQMHISHNWPAMSEIRRVVDGIVERGLMVHISELDIKINPTGDLLQPTEERFESQKQRVMDIVEMYQSIPEELQFGITMWGLRDPDSWLIEFEGRQDWALLFDDDFEPKPAYFGFLEALD